MSKIKISAVLIFALISSATMFISCNNEEAEQKTEALNVEKVLFAKYKLIKSEKTNVNLSNLKSVSTFTKSDNVTEYTIENSVEKVMVITNSSKPNSYVVIKGFTNTGLEKKSSDISDFQITKELNIDIQLDSNGNGSLKVKNITDNEEFSQNLVNGKPTELANNVIATSSISFCQREESEGTKQCYLREVDEFCDGFIGCVALTQASVHILIASLCSC